MNDDFESRLRDDLHRRASAVDVPAAPGGLAIADDAQRARAARHRRRMVMSSVATVAAVSAGLIVISRDPGTQDVSTDRNEPAAQGLTGGASTGSSTGSASGSPTGWSTTGNTSDPTVPPRFALRAPAGYKLDMNRYAREQGAGQAAADLAVAADVRVGSRLRFVVASVQDADRLTSGRGGTEVTIAGRPGRVISHRAATLITWEISEGRRALVYAAGVDDATLEAWLGSLAAGADGVWRFAEGVDAGGLESVATTTPTTQATEWTGWVRDEIAADGTCDVSGFTFETVTGGSYELWARLVDGARWTTVLPEVVEVTLPWSTTPSVAFTSEFMGLSTMAGDVVISVNSWEANGASTLDPQATASLVYEPTAEEWATAIGADVPPTTAQLKVCEEPSTAPTTMPPVGADGSPPVTTLVVPDGSTVEIPPPTPAPTTTPPATAPPTTIDLRSSVPTVPAGE